MANETRDAATGGLLKLAGAMEVHKDEMPHMEASRLKFMDLLATYQQIRQEQADLTGRKQEITKRLLLLLGELKRLASLLRMAIREHFGSRSEKLAEFGLQPFRGRRRKVAPAEETPEVTGGASQAGTPKTPRNSNP